MNYTVAWRKSALDALADLYVTLSLIEQERLSIAIAKLNGDLAYDPLTVGESRDYPLRVTFVLRHVVTFSTSEVNRYVAVLKIV